MGWITDKTARRIKAWVEAGDQRAFSIHLCRAQKDREWYEPGYTPGPVNWLVCVAQSPPATFPDGCCINVMLEGDDPDVLAGQALDKWIEAADAMTVSPPWPTAEDLFVPPEARR